jgi:hypothetical protein
MGFELRAPSLQPLICEYNPPVPQGQDAPGARQRQALVRPRSVRLLGNLWRLVAVNPPHGSGQLAPETIF